MKYSNVLYIREGSMEKNYFSIILYHTDSDRNNKREKIFSSSCLYITLYIYIYIIRIIPIFTYRYLYRYRQVKYAMRNICMNICIFLLDDNVVSSQHQPSLSHFLSSLTSVSDIHRHSSYILIDHSFHVLRNVPHKQKKKKKLITN